MIGQQRNGSIKLPRSTTVDRQVHEEQIRQLEGRLRQERRKSRQLRERIQHLKGDSKARMAATRPSRKDSSA